MSNFNTTCVNADHWENLFILPLPIISFLLNILLFIAATVNRRKLQRQNYIYLCVISTLLSNALYLVFHIWYLFGNYFSDPQVYGKAEKTIWILCQAAVVSLQYVMCGNIGALLFVVLDTTYFVGRSVNRKASEFAKDFVDDVNGVGQRRWVFKAKRQRALFFVIIAWLVPLCLTLAATLKWNCTETCIYCVGGRADGDLCPFGSGCSRVWTPVRNDYLGVHVALWIIENLALLVIIISGIRSFRQVMAPPNRKKALTDLPNVDVEPIADGTVPSISENVANTNNEVGREEANREDAVATETPHVSVEESNNRDENKRRPGKFRTMFRLHSRITFMIVISVTFFVCTIPLVVSFLLDVSSQDFHTTAAYIISTVSIYIYTILCPIILLKYLPSLKSALISLMCTCSCSRLPSMYRRRSTNRQARKSTNSCQ